MQNGENLGIGLRDRDPVALLHGELACVETLNDIIRLSVAFDKPLRIKNDLGSTKEVLGDYSNDKEKKYRRYGDVITYYYEGVQYEIHYTSEVEKILLDSGFAKDESIEGILWGGLAPVDYLDFWKEQEEASRCIESNNSFARKRSERKEEVERARKQAGCTPISDDLLRTRCFRIPVNGIDVLYRKGSDRPKVMLPIDSKLIGKMSKSENLDVFCTFVYLDGYTYTTTSDEVRKELQEHGFTFSNDIPALRITGVGGKTGSLRGDYEIIDPFYAEQANAVMVSDAEYSETAGIGFTARKIAYLEEKNEALEERVAAEHQENEQLKRVLANRYLSYRRKQEEKGEMAVSPQEFFIDEFGLDLDLSDDFIGEVESSRKR